MRYIFVVFLSLFIVGCQTTSTPEPVASAQKCPMPDPERDFARWNAHVMQQNPGVRRMEVEDVATFMRGYNASPPRQKST